MKSIMIGCLAALFLLPACSRQNDNSASKAPAEANAESASATLATLVEEYFERSLELNPILATSIGDDRYADRLANWLSPDYIAQSEALDTEFLERLLAIDESVLEEPDLCT